MTKKEKSYRKYILISMFIFCLLISFVWIILVKNEQKVSVYRFDKSMLVTKDFTSKVDSVNITDNFVEITGWLIKDNYEPKVIEEYILLRDNENKICYKIPTEIVRREDIKNLGNNDKDYSLSGFYAKANKKYIDINKNYEIYLLYLNDSVNNIVPLNVTTKGWESDEK